MTFGGYLVYANNCSFLQFQEYLGPAFINFYI